MFDGNHRVRRREINLSGGGKSSRRTIGANKRSVRTATTPGAGNKSLLEKARVQREARRLAQLRNTSSVSIQRIYRGYMSREKVGRDLAGTMFMSVLETPSDKSKPGLRSALDPSIESVRREASVLAMRLSPSLLPFWPVEGCKMSSVDVALMSSKTSRTSINSSIKTSTSGRCEPMNKSGKDIDDRDEHSGILKTLQEMLEFSRAFASVSSVPPSAWSFVGNEISDAKANGAARWAFVGTRIGRNALNLLILLGQQRFLTGDGTDIGGWNDEEVESAALTLCELVSRLCGTSPGHIVTGLALGSSRRNISGKEDAKEDKDGGLLFLALREWFLNFSHGSMDGNGTAVARTLLGLSSLAIRLIGTTDSVRSQERAVLAPFSVLATVLLGTPDLMSHPLYAELAGAFPAPTMDVGSSNFGDGFWASAVESLVAAEHRMGQERECARPGVVQKLLKDRELFVLSNAIQLLLLGKDSCSGSARNFVGEIHPRVAHALSRILWCTLRRRPELGYLSSMVGAHGVKYLEQWALRSSGDGDERATDLDEGVTGRNSFDDSSSSMDEDEEVVVHRPVSQMQQQQKLSRSDLLTAKGLDLLMHKEDARQRMEAVALIRSRGRKSDRDGRTLLKLASILGEGDLLLRLGMQVWKASGIRCTVGIGDSCNGLDDNNSDNDARAAYCHVMFVVSASSAGLRAGSSPFLSKIAFAPAMAVGSGIWGYVRALLASETSASSCSTSVSVKNGSETQRYYHSRTGALLEGKTAACAAMAVFCDILSHRLLAVDDEEFAGDMSSAGFNPPEVVRFLNRVLYHLYWTNPVVSSDVAPSSMRIGGVLRVGGADEDGDDKGTSRVRLFLSGTKLYNSLYERCLRLERPFSEESSWWWPRLVSSSMRGGGNMGRRSREERGGAVRAAALSNRNGWYEDSDDSDVEMLDEADTSVTTGGTEESRGALTVQDEENEALAAAFRDPKMARVLTGCPQAVPFERRVALFHTLLEADKKKTQDEMVGLRSLMMNELMEDGALPGRVQVRVRRDSIYEDSLEQLNDLGTKLREKVQVTLVNRHGTEESGIDGGGVFKEFLDDLIKEAFNPAKVGLFAVSPMQALYVNNGGNFDPRDITEEYEFVGRVLGKAVYESILVEPQFSLPFLNILLGRQNTLDDLKRFDPELYRHLRSLRQMGDEVASLGLTFEVTSTMDGRGHFMGGLKTIPLIPNGASIPVTRQNAVRYVHLLAHHKLNVEGSLQTKAFLRGFRDLIPAAWVRLFSARELQKLISGDDAVKGIDVEGMRRVMQYAGGYHPTQPIMVWFWEVVTEMTPEQQRKFLKFMTSCSRQPLLGFQALQPPPCVQEVRASTEGGNTKLPTSSTCMNLLKLPKYNSKKVLREKLLYSIEAEAGFELT